MRKQEVERVMRKHELWFKGMEKDENLGKFSDLNDWKTILQLFRDSQRKMAVLKHSDRVSELPQSEKEKIDNTARKIDNTLDSLAQRFHKEYGVDAFQWLDKIEKQ